MPPQRDQKSTFLKLLQRRSVVFEQVQFGLDAVELRNTRSNLTGFDARSVGRSRLRLEMSTRESRFDLNYLRGTIPHK